MTALSPRAVPGGQHVYTGTLTLVDSVGNPLIAASANLITLGNSVNNPQLAFPSTAGVTAAGPVISAYFTPTSGTVPSGATGIFLPGANTLGLVTNGILYGTLDATGHWSLNAPTTGILATLTLAALANCNALLSQSTTTASQSFGLDIRAGTNTSDWSAVFRNAVGQNLVLMRGDGQTFAADDGLNLKRVGWLDAVQNVQNGNYSVALTDRGGSIAKTGGGSSTWTIPANSSVTFPIGTTILLFVALGVNNVTLAISTDQLVWATGSGVTGSRTLNAPCLATLYKGQSTQWTLSGSNIS